MPLRQEVESAVELHPEFASVYVEGGEEQLDVDLGEIEEGSQQMLYLDCEVRPADTDPSGHLEGPPANRIEALDECLRCGRHDVWAMWPQEAGSLWLPQSKPSHVYLVFLGQRADSERFSVRPDGFAGVAATNSNRADVLVGNPTGSSVIELHVEPPLPVTERSQ